jgi:hypothetical protein
MLADLFAPIKPPAIRDSDVSVRHIFMGTEPKHKEKRTYYVGRTAEQKERRRIMEQMRRRRANPA